MALFTNYPVIAYNNTSMRDLSVRVTFREAIKQNKNLYFKYQVSDQETPEDIAFNQYGDANRHWVILFMNDIVDPYYGWILSRREVQAYAEAKYGKPSISDGKYNPDGFNAVHHWESTSGTYYYVAPNGGIGQAPESAIPITFLEYEERLNDAKREINLIYPDYIENIERELKYLIDNGY
jgi:hypothetical protein